MTQSLRSADERKLVHKRKCMELKLFLPGSPGGSKKKKKKKSKNTACQVRVATAAKQRRQQSSPRCRRRYPTSASRSTDSGSQSITPDNKLFDMQGHLGNHHQQPAAHSATYKKTPATTQYRDKSHNSSPYVCECCLLAITL